MFRLRINRRLPSGLPIPSSRKLLAMNPPLSTLTGDRRTPVPSLPSASCRPGPRQWFRRNRFAFPRRRRLSPEEYAQGVLRGDRSLLAQTITVVESDAPRANRGGPDGAGAAPAAHRRSVRIGINGRAWGREEFAHRALRHLAVPPGKRVAVLAVDPSSSVSHGAFWATRPDGATRPRAGAFIRPSPSGGALGGVARKTRETILVCEAAGYDVILVETVGVGQSEIAVRSMVDFLLLLTITGGGDDLQGMKRGSLELADAVAVTKADGDNLARAQVTRRMLQDSLHYFAPPTPGWAARALTCSARTGEGIDALWVAVEEFLQVTRENGAWLERRRRQNLAWAQSMIEETLRSRFFQRPKVAARRAEWERQVLAGSIPVTAAVRELLALGGE